MMAIKMFVRQKRVSMSVEKQSVNMLIENARVVEVFTGDGEVYDGNYVVTPDVESQKLETSQKYMKDDVVIKAIPYYDVGNTSGGITVYIGKEII